MDKTNKQTSDVILYDNRVVVFKMEGDVMLYVVGGADENEVLLFSVVLALRDSLNILLKCAHSTLSLLACTCFCFCQLLLPQSLLPLFCVSLSIGFECG